MVDILQALEAATYMAFIAGAVFAVVELRAISRDRRTDMLLRLNDHWSSKEFEEAVNPIRLLMLVDAKDPAEIEKRCSFDNLMTVIDYLDGIGELARLKLLDKDFIAEMLNWTAFWSALGPWIEDARAKYKSPRFAEGFQFMADEERRISSREASN